MKQQVVVIHGGTTFDSYDNYINYLKTLPVSLDYLKKSSWKDSLQKDLGDDFDVVRLQMPNKTNAKYSEWKIYFERYLPLLNETIILIGHSLGGLFLTKYLSENIFPKKIGSLFLIAAPHPDIEIGESLGDFTLPKNLSKISSQVKNIFIFHSEDDPVVPSTHAEKYKELLPQALIKKFADKKHFSSAEFPELIEHLKNDS